MAESKKSKKNSDDSNGAETRERSLQELILNKRTGKYEVIDQMSFWAKHLRSMEEHRHLTQTEILDLAISQVLSGKADPEEITKLMAGDAKAKKKEAAEKSAKK